MNQIPTNAERHQMLRDSCWKAQINLYAQTPVNAIVTSPMSPQHLAETLSLPECLEKFFEVERSLERCHEQKKSREAG